MCALLVDFLPSFVPPCSLPAVLASSCLAGRSAYFAAGDKAAVPAVPSATGGGMDHLTPLFGVWVAGGVVLRLLLGRGAVVPARARR